MSDSDSAWINISHVSMDFTSADGQQFHALDDVSFDVARKEFVCIIGPSGCGKTTLLRMLAGLAEPTAGTLALGGVPLGKRRQDVGMVFQAPTLLAWKTIIGNVLLPVGLHRRVKKADRDRAEELLELVGLGGFANRYPKELSGGMQQRAGICRALMHDPDLLLLDEPFGAIDAMSREMMNIELLRIWQASQKTAVLVTHSIPEAVFLADRVIVMSTRPGRIDEIVDIDLPRPRDPSLMSTPRFGELTDHLRRHFVREQERQAQVMIGE